MADFVVGNIRSNISDDWLTCRILIIVNVSKRLFFYFQIFFPIDKLWSKCLYLRKEVIEIEKICFMQAGGKELGGGEEGGLRGNWEEWEAGEGEEAEQEGEDKKEKMEKKKTREEEEKKKEGGAQI